ncbi:hypothetical protein CDAR_52631 [Caerostris darwini]|uniref:Uncharacterized protein n=1 Tax=Caerostris darwini TaxID=1538125 RepID=A0AAV4T501_9ARAC|nr:hypothetical protein CDAR_52631 [Caerostris darwini]
MRYLNRIPTHFNHAPVEKNDRGTQIRCTRDYSLLTCSFWCTVVENIVLSKDAAKKDPHGYSTTTRKKGKTRRPLKESLLPEWQWANSAIRGDFCSISWDFPRRVCFPFSIPRRKCGAAWEWGRKTGLALISNGRD